MEKTNQLFITGLTANFTYTVPYTPGKTTVLNVKESLVKKIKSKRASKGAEIECKDITLMTVGEDLKDNELVAENNTKPKGEGQWCFRLNKAAQYIDENNFDELEENEVTTEQNKFKYNPFVSLKRFYAANFASKSRKFFDFLCGNKNTAGLFEWLTLGLSRVPYVSLLIKVLLYFIAGILYLPSLIVIVPINILARVKRGAMVSEISVQYLTTKEENTYINIEKDSGAESESYKLTNLDNNDNINEEKTTFKGMFDFKFNFLFNTLSMPAYKVQNEKGETQLVFAANLEVDPQEELRSNELYLTEVLTDEQLEIIEKDYTVPSAPIHTESSASYL